ncbi:sulfur carrier protein ThiS [Parvularcula sp. IMCC14364]|uniref:sulfur carrier protein ThiS n=1 Tax=Parvularcula sp. IMCC14364 TaxID=3067902 RepID=UPI0027419E81|nr:sulfur carrier protein ThiS [Parvularcula sp. IMCC14364]
MSEIHISVNGTLSSLKAGLTLSDLLAQLELKPTKIAVERNREIVPKSAFQSTTLHEGDQLEIVQFVGGG